MNICECNTYICTYMCEITERKEVINLKESEEGYMEVEKGRNKCCNYILYLKRSLLL